MQITVEQLKLLGSTTKNAVNFVQPINDTLVKYNINTIPRVQHFLAQVFHESGCLFYVRELASGSAYDVGQLAINLGNTPQDDGDGEKYKGRGLIQITGTANYRTLSKAFGVDFLKNPELLETPKYAALSAGWFWDTRKLNNLADAEVNEKPNEKGIILKMITKKINGGYNGLEHRRELLSKAKLIFK